MNSHRRCRRTVETSDERVRARIRFDFRGARKPNRFLLGSRDPEEVAGEIREREAILLQKVPIQGIRIENIDISAECFRVTDPVTGEDLAYAPAQVVVDADSVEDLARFTLRNEFRTIDIMEPEHLCLSNRDMGRLLFKVGEEMRHGTGYNRRP